MLLETMAARTGRHSLGFLFWKNESPQFAIHAPEAGDCGAHQERKRKKKKKNQSIAYGGPPVLGIPLCAWRRRLPPTSHLLRYSTNGWTPAMSTNAPIAKCTPGSNTRSRVRPVLQTSSLSSWPCLSTSTVRSQYNAYFGASQYTRVDEYPQGHRVEQK